LPQSVINKDFYKHHNTGVLAGHGLYNMFVCLFSYTGLISEDH